MADGRTDGQTDKSDFIGRCPTNVEGPILMKIRNFAEYNFVKYAKIQEYTEVRK